MEENNERLQFWQKKKKGNCLKISEGVMYKSYIYQKYLNIFWFNVNWEANISFPRTPSKVSIEVPVVH